MASEIYFVRHGESLDNVAGVAFDQMSVNEDGSLDNPLSELGEQQAKAAAIWLANHVSADALFSSGLARADMTAAPISAAFGLPVNILPEMREIMVEAKSLEKLELENNISRTLYKVPGGKKIRDTFMDGGIIAAFNIWRKFGLPGFEPKEDMFARARYVIETLSARPERRIVACAHNYFINSVLCILIEMDPANAARLTNPLGLLPNCSVTCVVAHPPRFRVRYSGRKTSDLT